MATFKELRAGSTVYFLAGKNDEIDIKQGVVTKGPGMSHAPTPQPGQPINYLAPSVIDIEIELEGTSKSYEIQDTAEWTYGGGMLIATDIGRILSEIENIAAQAQERYNNRDKDKACIERCDALRLQWDPKAKEQKALDDRFKRLEEAQAKSNENYSDIKSLLSKISQKLDI